MFSRFDRWTDTRRTPKDDLRLGICLAFVAGATNAGGFLAVGQYTSHMTGIVSGVADHLALSETMLVLSGLASVMAFVCGAMTTAILVNYARRQRLRAQFSIPLLLESALLLLFGLMGTPLAESTAFLLPTTVVMLCFLMGLQNAVITKISSAVIRTTHVTGLVTDIGIELGRLVYVNRQQPGRHSLVRANRKKLKLHTFLLGSFLAGGVIGAIGFQRMGYTMTVPLAAVLLALSLPPLLHDVRIRSKLLRRRATS